MQHDTTGEYTIFWCATSSLQGIALQLHFAGCRFAFIPHILLPQRGANFAYPMVMLVLLLIWKARCTSSFRPVATVLIDVCVIQATDAAAAMTSGDRRSMLINAAAFAALLPLVQVRVRTTYCSFNHCCCACSQAHSFLGLGLIIGTVFLLDFHKWMAVRAIAPWVCPYLTL